MGKVVGIRLGDFVSRDVCSNSLDVASSMMSLSGNYLFVFFFFFIKLNVFAHMNQLIDQIQAISKIKRRDT